VLVSLTALEEEDETLGKDICERGENIQGCYSENNRVGLERRLCFLETSQDGRGESEEKRGEGEAKYIKQTVLR
jgi:hypothetical protein